jgi:hypothetical protein
MSLVALVDNRQVDKPLKKRNDIILVKLSDSPWSEMETKYFLRIEIDDPDLETELVLKRAQGELYPVAVYPYAVYEDVTVGPNGEEWIEKRMTKRSTYRFQRHLMSKNTIEDQGSSLKAMNNNDTVTPVLKKKKLGQIGKPLTLEDLTE